MSSVYAELASTWSRIVGWARTACVLSYIAAGLDLDLDAAIALRQIAIHRAHQRSGAAWMPTDTPTSTHARCPPNRSRSERPSRLPCKSHSASSSRAFAIGWPRTCSAWCWKSAGPATSWPKIAGARKSRRTCQAVPDVS